MTLHDDPKLKRDRHDLVVVSKNFRAIETSLGRKAALNLLPMQPGDMVTTYADPWLVQALTGYCPSTRVETGVKAFVDWYKERPRG